MTGGKWRPICRFGNSGFPRPDVIQAGDLTLIEGAAFGPDGTVRAGAVDVSARLVVLFLCNGMRHRLLVRGAYVRPAATDGAVDRHRLQTGGTIVFR